MGSSRSTGRFETRPAEPDRPRGRPRSREAEDAILDATLDLLGREGYGRMSIDAVARKARVSKPTIYRRWSSKADLAMAALARRIDAEPEHPITGTPRDDLVGALRRLRDRLASPNNMALVGTALSEESQTPELVALFRTRVWKRRHGILRSILERAVNEGELRSGVDADVAIDLLIGSMYAAYLTHGKIPRDWPERTVALLWAGIGSSRRQSASR